MDLRAVLKGRGISYPHRDSISGPSRPYRVATPTTLSQPNWNGYEEKILLPTLRQKLMSRYLLKGAGESHKKPRPEMPVVGQRSEP